MWNKWQIKNVWISLNLNDFFLLFFFFLDSCPAVAELMKWKCPLWNELLMNSKILVISIDCPGTTYRRNALVNLREWGLRTSIAFREMTQNKSIDICKCARVWRHWPWFDYFESDAKLSRNSTSFSLELQRPWPFGSDESMNKYWALRWDAYNGTSLGRYLQ